MKRINNPLQGKKGYHCFGCDPDSKVGLRMEFYEDGDEVVSQWKPRPEFQGWVNTLHGGIQGVLVDEISSWVIFSKFHTSGVTTRMEVRYHKPISTLDEYITLRARAVEQRRNLVKIEVLIFNQAGERCTEGTCTYFTYPQEKGAKDLEFLEEDQTPCSCPKHKE